MGFNNCKKIEIEKGWCTADTDSKVYVFLSDKEPTVKTLDFTIRIGSTPTFFYFDSYLDTACLSTLHLIAKK